jgi:hypothetical protein
MFDLKLAQCRFKLGLGIAIPGSRIPGSRDPGPFYQSRNPWIRWSQSRDFGIGNSMNLKCKFLKIVDCGICGFTLYGPVIYLLLILSMG